jgi:hypothetical protein
MRNLYGKEKEHELHGFQPLHDRDCNEGLRQEVSILRLEKRLWETRVPRSSRLIALAHRFALPMLRHYLQTQCDGKE